MVADIIVPEGSLSLVQVGLFVFLLVPLYVLLCFLVCYLFTPRYRHIAHRGTSDLPEAMDLAVVLAKRRSG